MERCCPHCGAVVPRVGDAFCSDCREPLDEPLQPVSTEAAGLQAEVVGRPKAPSRQLVGLPCVLCRKTIGSVVDGRFCVRCGCPVHLKCVSQADCEARDAGNCSTCGAKREDMDREQGLHQQEVKVSIGDAKQRRGLLLIAVWAFLMLLGVFQMARSLVTEGELNFGRALDAAFPLLPAFVGFVGTLVWMARRPK